MAPDDTDPTAPRTLRALVPVELAVFAVLALAVPSDRVPVVLPLLIAASVSRWIRRRDWAALAHGDRWMALIGALAGLVALAGALGLGAPVVEALTGRAVEWSAFPIVRGNASQAFTVALLVVAVAVASELVLRGWIVERLLELSPGPAALPVALGAAAEALVTPGGFAIRLGAAAFGAGLGAIYIAAGRSVVAPICARVAFALGALGLEALRLVG